MRIWRLELVAIKGYTQITSTKDVEGAVKGNFLVDKELSHLNDLMWKGSFAIHSNKGN